MGSDDLEAHWLVSGLERRTDLKLEALREVVDLRFESQEKATILAVTNINERQMHANGLIGQMHDMTRTFPSMERVDALAKRIELIEQHNAGSEGRVKAGQPMRDVLMLAVGSLVAYIMTKATNP